LTHKYVYDLMVFSSLLSDRSVLDCLVYAIWLNKQGKVSSACVEEIRKAYQYTHWRYDYQFYTPIEFSIQEDGVRSLDESFRNGIAEIFEGIMDQYPRGNY